MKTFQQFYDEYFQKRADNPEYNNSLAEDIYAEYELDTSKLSAELEQAYKWLDETKVTCEALGITAGNFAGDVLHLRAQVEQLREEIKFIEDGLEMARAVSVLHLTESNTLRNTLTNLRKRSNNWDEFCGWLDEDLYTMEHVYKKVRELNASLAGKE